MAGAEARKERWSRSRGGFRLGLRRDEGRRVTVSISWIRFGSYQTQLLELNYGINILTEIKSNYP